MAEVRNRTLSIAWWNTGLNPIRGESGVDLKALFPVILLLCASSDIVMLCEHFADVEICRKINRALRDKQIDKDFRIRDLSHKAGHAGFKMSMLFDAQTVDQVRLAKSRCAFLDLAGHVNENHYRAGQLIRFNTAFLGETPLDVYAMHWSQYDEKDGEVVKLTAAGTMASHIAKSKRNYVVCAGDFNTEPYSPPMANLGASRSLRYVINGDAPFYNPFWKFMPYCGTIKSKAGRCMKCESPTFDQMLIGRRFLTEGIAYRVDVWGDEIYHPGDGGHRPVVLTFQRQGGENDRKA